MNERRDQDTIRLPIQSNRLPPVNIINRREIEPLLLKAREIVKFYEQAVNCVVVVLDQTDSFIEIPDYEKTLYFCKLCKEYRLNGVRTETDFPCEQMHLGAVTEAQHIGGAYIYMCELGFTYWTSIFYSGGCCTGALIAGKFLAIEREKVIEKLRNLTGGAIPAEDLRSRLEDIPEKSQEEITSLARLLQACADRISDSTEDYREVIDRMTERNSRLLTQIRFIKTRRSDIPNADYPMDKERMLLAALRRGDNESGRRILNELLESIFITNPDNFEFIRLRAI
jgi:ligand-binding sensor protein